jgi:serine/threonine protein kinase
MRFFREKIASNRFDTKSWSLLFQTQQIFLLRRHLNREEPVNFFGIACNNWSLGCLFFYFLRRGVHPYGEEDDAIRWKIVVKQNPAEFASMQASKHEKVYDLIRDMIDPQPEKRIHLNLS